MSRHDEVSGDAQGVRGSLLEMRYYDSYSYAQVVSRTLKERFNFLRGLHDFFNENEAFLGFIDPFPKWTLLHQYAVYCIETVEFEEFPKDEDVQRAARYLKYEPDGLLLGVEEALRAHGITFERFEGWLSDSGIALDKVCSDDAYEYYEYIRDQRTALYERMAEEVFFLCFMNRGLLLRLNDLAAEAIREGFSDGLGPEALERFTKSGTLRRQKIPAWAKRAVFFRDRGRCVYCLSDLSGLGALSRGSHYDHMVPLVGGGANCVTNLQLLCTRCNLAKGGTGTGTRDHVERWF